MTGRVVVLTGGVGGAKLVHGLARALPAGEVTAIVNTGDDFEHLGLQVSPDIDTLLYTLSGQANGEQGWGREHESWHFMAAVGSLGGPTWFRLGDGDLALHVLRTQALSRGIALSQVIAGFATSWEIRTRILPATDMKLATLLDTDQGVLPFQTYFVAQRCEPVVRGIRFDGAETCVPSPGVIAAISDPANQAVLIAPSNPFLSIDPILAVPGIREALANSPAPVVAVSPLVGGRAVKGPTAKIMGELGLPISAKAVAAHYGGLLRGLVIDHRDPHDELEVRSIRMDTLMLDTADRVRLALATLDFAKSLR